MRFGENSNQKEDFWWKISDLSGGQIISSLSYLEGIALGTYEIYEVSGRAGSIVLDGIV